MKKLLVLMLVIVICFSLGACSKSEAAQAADDLIAAIGEVSLNTNESNIIAAEQAVKELTPGEQKQLENLKILEQARKTYNELLVEKVESSISRIGTVTLQRSQAITTARTLYDSLDAKLQSMVSNYGDLEAAEAALFQAKVSDIENAISAIGTVTLGSGNKITQARKVYNSYATDVQHAVGNYNILVSAEELYPKLRSDNVINLINAIGKVTLTSSEAIEKARTAYENLTPEEEKDVTNLAVLTKAETTYADLVKTSKEKELKDALTKLNKNIDKVEGIIWYHSPREPEYANIRSYVLPYIGQMSEQTWLRLRFLYTGDDWIFFDNLIVLIDSQRYYKAFSYFEVERENDSGDVWEWVDFSPTDADVEMLWEIVNSKETIVRFSGDNYYEDITISSADKKAIKEVLEAYELLKAEEEVEEY